MKGLILDRKKFIEIVRNEVKKFKPFGKFIAELWKDAQAQGISRAEVAAVAGKNVPAFKLQAFVVGEIIVAAVVFAAAAVASAPRLPPIATMVFTLFVSLIVLMPWSRLCGNICNSSSLIWTLQTTHKKSLKH